MFVSDLKRDFFSLLQNARGSGGGRVLVLANLDVDALCSVKILQHLFHCDQISYTLLPVAGRAEWIAAFKSHYEQGGLKYVLMINCGATVDIVQDFGLNEEDDEEEDGSAKEEVVIFVADAHRPVDVCNVYNDSQVRLLMAQDNEGEGIPDFDGIFRDSDSEDDDDEGGGGDDDDEGGGGEKRRRFDEQAILKRRDRRLWEDKRSKVLFDYSQYSFFGRPTSLLMYDLAWKMSRDTNELLWFAIVGHTEQALMLKGEDEKQLLETGTIRDHVSRLNNQENNAAAANSHDDESSASSASVNTLRLAFDKELNLTLYRHWTLYDSLLNSIYTASKFRTWTVKGRQRLSEYLAELGLPLAQCRQKFATMDLGLRNDITGIFEAKAEKYGLDALTHGSFTCSFGYRHKFSAADIVHAARALMERTAPAGEEAVTADTAFLRALDSLSRKRLPQLVEDGVGLARQQIEQVIRQVQNFLDLRQVVSAGPFLYAVIQEGAPGARAFAHPNCLALLAQYTLRAYASLSGSKKSQALPLVVSAPLDKDEGTCLVVGVPPVNDRSRKNFLGKAFEQALTRTHCRYRLNYFDTSLVQVKSEDRAKFFDGLISLLT